MKPEGKLAVNPDAFLQYSLAAFSGGLLENLMTSGLSVPLFLGFGTLAGSLAVFLYYKHKGNRWMCSGMHMFAAAFVPALALVFGVVTKVAEILVK